MSPYSRVPVLDGPDLAVVKDIVRFGWLATDQIARRYGLPPTSNPAQLERLHPLLLKKNEQWPLSGGGAIYSATRLGARTAGVGLCAVDIDRRYVYHHLTVADVADALLAHDPDARWRTEREYVRVRNRRAKHNRWAAEGHVPDGILVSSVGRRIAIEVELSEKDWLRYVAICRWYAEQFEIDELRWYVGVPALKTRLPRIMRQHGLTEDLGMTVLDLPPGVEVRR